MSNRNAAHESLQRIASKIKFEILLTANSRRRLLPLLWLVLCGHDYAIIDNRVFVIVSAGRTPARVIGNADEVQHG